MSTPLPSTNATQRLVEGFAQLLAADADPALNIAWQSTGQYAAGTVGIWPMIVPTSPDQVITITPFEYRADPTMSSVDGAIQLRYRASTDARILWQLRDACRFVLAGLFPVTLPTGVRITSLQFASGVSLGADDARRWEWADTYDLSWTDPRR